MASRNKSDLKKKGKQQQKGPGPEERVMAPEKDTARRRFWLRWPWVLTCTVVVAASAWFLFRNRPAPELGGGKEPTVVRKWKPGQIQFENRQPASAVEFVLDNGTTGDKPIIDSMLGGVALLDYDRDGFLDIYFTSGAGIPSLTKDKDPFSNRLYRNRRDGTFEDVTKKSGVRGAGYSIGVAAADYDNDGYPDLYVAGVNENTLYHNNRDGTFADSTKTAGVGGSLAGGKKAWSIGGGWLDYDNDGKLDLFVVNYVDWSPANNVLCGDPGKRLSCSPVGYAGLPNILYRNNGDGTFTDVSASTGIGSHIGKGMGVALADFNDDGFMDIFVGNDTERNFLFQNHKGRSFSEVGVEAGVAFSEDGVPISSMGADFRDVNNDGLPDITIAALANETFPLFLNTRKGYFVDSTYRSGIGTSSYTTSGWGTGIFDFDNDGFKDIFAAGCHVSENIEKYRNEKYKLPNVVWQNEGGDRFRVVGEEGGPALQAPAAHRGVSFGDLDNDGRIDAVVSVIGGKAEILLNLSARQYKWIIIETEGTASNRDGIGTRIRLTGESGFVQYNQVSTCVGYASSSDRRVHFGLGPDQRIREIEFRWPSGKRQVLKDVPANQILKVREH